MSVWLTIPSARPPEQANPILQRWRDQGYRIALWADTVKDGMEKVCDTFLSSDKLADEGKYPGYALSVNRLIKAAARAKPDAEWFVIGGDDTLPDPNHTAEEIAKECKDHFYVAVELTYPPDRPSWVYDEKRVWSDRCGGNSYNAWGLFGVMQPTGDAFAGRQIERICGSPWIGREYALRVNQGKGPLWPEYKHMFADEEIMEVAKKYGVLWQRRDLTHYHNHWTRNGDQADYSKPLPHFLREANSPEHWKRYGDIFRARKAAGFPGSELEANAFSVR